MDKAELHEARTNPDFLNYLEQTRLDAIETENISALYEVLDSMLILDLDEEKINNVYENILKISFEQIEKIVNANKKLKLQNDEILYIRSFYEHAIEKWSYNDFEGAKEFLFLLIHIIEDEKLINALTVHFIACCDKLDLDGFYETKVDTNVMDVVEQYGYFIIHFLFDEASYIKEHEAVLNVEFAKLKHLLD
ncbi:hypothetical protein [Candidatus Marinarcus aquaticus]|uniref:Uncharacterized protein n=1 Tax=Candidatus Marinarcus aquaticus TaxID=2044504 RepID=A0A4Q0XPH8_9BACT|nr:hypothetical protein [Candidatus Marinarcus aquaticus]RXJ56396.1 hypothetical protein CRV04_08240 [Candidatus Marinarcus aquaticus]